MNLRPAFLIISILLLTFVGTSCTTQKENASTSFKSSFITPIEEAHNNEEWLNKSTFKADITITFGGNTALEATMYMHPASGKTRLNVDENISVGYNGKDIWITPNDSALARADFHVLTWSYFLAAPYKLDDPGTQLSDEGVSSLRGKDYDTAKLTFEAGTGETPDDWYMLYRDQETNKLFSMAYVVTYGKTLEEANQEPHAITYHDFKTIDGVPISTSWKFWGWSAESGLGEQQIGSGTLSNVAFVEVDDGFYKKAES